MIRAAYQVRRTHSNTTHTLHTIPFVPSSAGGGICFASHPCLDVVHVPRGRGGIHIFDITRVLRARRVFCVVLVLRVLPCLACITLLRANRGGVVQTCRIGGPLNTMGLLRRNSFILTHSSGFRRGGRGRVPYSHVCHRGGIHQAPSLSVVSSA